MLLYQEAKGLTPAKVLSQELLCRLGFIVHDKDQRPPARDFIEGGAARLNLYRTRTQGCYEEDDQKGLPRALGVVTLGH